MYGVWLSTTQDDRLWIRVLLCPGYCAKHDCQILQQPAHMHNLPLKGFRTGWKQLELGVAMGCTISPILFMIAFKVILRGYMNTEYLLYLSLSHGRAHNSQRTPKLLPDTITGLAGATGAFVHVN